jgi:hypothetical protein
MFPVSRRLFTKQLLTASVLPLAKSYPQEAHFNESRASLRVPDSIAGYTLTEDEKELAAKFLSDHERKMNSLRGTGLPNNLAPAIRFCTQRMSANPGEPDDK